jgi:hypothetical protein
MFGALKDSVASQAALSFANSRFGKYGVVQELKIDSQRKTVDVTFQPEGEPTPIKLRVENYRIDTVGDKKFIQVSGFTCSRPWLHSLLDDFAKNRRVELPPWAAAAL